MTSEVSTRWSLFFLMVEPHLPYSGVSFFSQWRLFLFLRVEFCPLQPHHHLQLILLLSVNDLKVHYANCKSRFISTCPSPHHLVGDWLDRGLFGFGEPTGFFLFYVYDPLVISRDPPFHHLFRGQAASGLRGDADKLRQKQTVQDCIVHI